MKHYAVLCDVMVLQITRLVRGAHEKHHLSPSWRVEQQWLGAI